MTRLHLRPGHDRRLRNGHPWIFSNEISKIEGVPQPGDALAVHAASGEFLGTAYYNPASLIAARLLSRSSESIDCVEFFRTRIADAAAYRQRFYGDLDAVRLVHGEGDGLPGLVVDRYGSVLSIQLLTLGMDRRRQLILEALCDLFHPQAVVARNDVSFRELEGLPQEVEILYGKIPEPLIVSENGLRFRVDVSGGQKTGHFLDQKENHRSLQGRVTGGRILDLFCYSGSWSIHAAHYGATSVTGLDISSSALDLAAENAALNGLSDKCSFVQADAFDWLQTEHHSGRKYDTIILDPPAFVKSKKKLQEAVRGYLTINRRAMNLVAPGGLLYTCSCSHHMDRELFLDTLHTAGLKARRTLRLLELRGQAFDHPVLLSCPETEYLKCAVLQVL